MTTDYIPNKHARLVFISAAEPSADRHAASLIRATHDVAPNVRFVGVAGPAMVEAGCDPIFDMTPHASMLLGVLTAAGRGIRMLKTCDEHLRRYPFDAAVVLDSPTLHLPLAAKAHALGLPVLYYIAPQLWAWGTYRLHRLRNNVDHVAAILPFEEAFFRDHGIDATFVGHPLADQLRRTTTDTETVRRIRERGQPIITILPGSRRHVVASVLPGQLDVARRIASVFRSAVFGVSIANPSTAPAVRACLAGAPSSIGSFTEHPREWIEAADLVLVASGTAALEIAFHTRPMIVMYNASRFFYHTVGRWLVHTSFLSLPNILADRKIVPEFMPYYRSTAPIADCAVELLRSPERRAAMTADLRDVVAPLRKPGASRRTAEILLKLMEHRS